MEPESKELFGRIQLNILKTDVVQRSPLLVVRCSFMLFTYSLVPKPNLPMRPPVI